MNNRMEITRKYCKRITVDRAELFLIRRSLEDYLASMKDTDFRNDIMMLLKRVREKAHELGEA